MAGAARVGSRGRGQESFCPEKGADRSVERNGGMDGDVETGRGIYVCWGWGKPTNVVWYADFASFVWDYR